MLNIHDINPALYGCQFGVAIQDGREYWPTADFSNYVQENFVGHAAISDTLVAGYQKNGITVDGPATTANLEWNTVNGAGRNNGNSFSPIIAQNGIQIGRGAAAQATYNKVTGNSYTGSGVASSGGILVIGGSCYSSPLTTRTLIDNNTVVNNDVGVYLSNLIVDNNNDCVQATTPTNIKVYKNIITNDAVSNVSGTNLYNYPGGYQAGISDQGYADSLTYNQICGVGYTPVPTPPPYLSQIDVAATNPIVKCITFCSDKDDITATSSARAKAGPHAHLRRVTDAVK